MSKEQDWSTQMEKFMVGIEECPECGYHLTREDLRMQECPGCANSQRCDDCNKVLKTEADINAGVCLDCDEYRCSKCGQEYDVEYRICGCGEFHPDIEFK